VPRHAPCLRPWSASAEARPAHPPALAGGQTAVAVLLVRAVHSVLAGGGSQNGGQRHARHQDHLPLLQRSTHAPVLGAASWSAAIGKALMGDEGREESTARAERSGAGAYRCAPSGAEVGAKAQRPLECFCPYQGGRNVAWQPSGSRGQSSGDAVSAAALTGPRAAAQTGIPLRQPVREPLVAWKLRRHRLGGVRHGGAVDDGGVGLVARSTERPYRSRPWAQRRGADGVQVRDGTDNSAHVQGADRRCARPQIHGGKGLPGGDAVLAGAQTGAASAAASCPQYLGKTGRTRERTAAARVG